ASAVCGLRFAYSDYGAVSFSSDLSMQESSATVTAFFVAPTVPAIGLALSSAYQAQEPMYLLLALVFYQFALYACLFVGLPAYFIGKWLKLIRWWSAAISGAIVGLVAELVLANGWSA